MPILGFDPAFVVRGEGISTLKLIAILTKIQTRAFQKHRTPVDKCRNAMAGQCNGKGEYNQHLLSPTGPRNTRT